LATRGEIGAIGIDGLRRLTFELSGRRRQDARPGPVKMYGVPPARAWWPAVGAPLERGVRQQRVRQENRPVLARWRFCSPLRGTARAVVVVRVRGACHGRFTASGAVLHGPRDWISWFCFHVSAQARRLVSRLHRSVRTQTCLPTVPLRFPLAAHGGVHVFLDWPAFAPALTEIRLFDLIDRSCACSSDAWPSKSSRFGPFVAV
jgi:hypothetical protein